MVVAGIGGVVAYLLIKNTDRLPIIWRMPLLVMGVLLPLALFEPVRSVSSKVVHNDSGVVVAIIGTVTAAALLCLAFIGRSARDIYPHLLEVGELSRLWTPMAAFVWSGCIGAVGLVSVLVNMIARDSSLPTLVRETSSVVTMAAALTLSVLLWIDIYQLVEWLDTEAQVARTSGG